MLFSTTFSVEIINAPRPIVTMSNRVWLFGRKRLDNACRQMKLAPEGKYLRTSFNSNPATAASSNNATRKPTKNAPPVNRLPVWYAAKANGNTTHNASTTAGGFVLMVSGPGSDLRH